ncbi:hypothetical protein [Leptospira noguchii]|uniref:Toxin-antitoxin system, toxin component n=1 Tax=Leptospira noguchii str. 2007001578 TaxID=1049974 RepID=A0ABP2TBH9_9LEPT|nr:hypothetical protein [Leptospira noguchii]EMN01102.1 hypothetical protein LEP1GSC035_4694 [Leptospira noguchii str. 2007001578]
MELKFLLDMNAVINQLANELPETGASFIEGIKTNEYKESISVN